MRKSTIILIVTTITAIGALFRLWDIHTTLPILTPTESLVSAIFGIAAIPGLYLLAQSFFNNRWVSFLAALFLAVSFWHVLFSRSNINATFMVTLLIWGVWLLWRCLHKQKKTHLWRIILAILVLALSVVIFIPPLASTQVNDVTLDSIAIKTIGMFHIEGDCNWQHNYARPAPLSGRPCAPMLLWPVGLLTLLGFVVSLIAIERKQQRNAHLILLAWLVASLLPPLLLHTQAPNALLSIGVLPVAYLYAALGGVWLLNLMKEPRRLMIFALIVILVGISVLQWHKYFVLWGNAPEARWAFEQPIIDNQNNQQYTQ